jgi:hypothetical protein
LPILDDAPVIKAAHLAVIEACAELQALVTGPKDFLFVNVKYILLLWYRQQLTWTQYTAYVSIRLRFNLDKSFAVGESTSFEAMASFSGLSVINVRRVVRHAILNHRFFQENKPGVITHSAPTAILVADELARNALIVQLEEFCPAGIKVFGPSMMKSCCGEMLRQGRRQMRWSGGRIPKRTMRR